MYEVPQTVKRDWHAKPYWMMTLILKPGANSEETNILSYYGKNK